MLDGKKTYIGLFIIFLGWFGLGDIISETELGTLVDSAMQAFGLIYSAYGRAVAKV